MCKKVKHRIVAMTYFIVTKGGLSNPEKPYFPLKTKIEWFYVTIPISLLFYYVYGMLEEGVL